MRDPLGRHARRVRRALEGRLGADETVEVFARDALDGDYWVVTTTNLIRIARSELRARISLAEAVGNVRETALGVTVRVSTKRGGPPLVTTFRKPNDVTRRLSELL